MASNRIQKVNELIKEEVSKILLTELGDHKGLLTITAVETTPDLRQATVWFRYLNGDETEIEKELKAKERSIQHEVNRKFTMKYVPKISFRYDKSGEYADKINELLKGTDDGNSITK
jgi:ribosome-binding factor A